MSLAPFRAPRRALIVAVALAALPVAAVPAHAASFNDLLVQAPTLAAPERGSVAGSLSKLSFGAGEMSRGSITVPSPFAVPGERGSMLAGVLPGYSPEGGISEWGMGWQAELAITRHRIVGDVDYSAADGFISPWGRLVAGSDGAYYPAGLQQPVRLVRGTDRWTATTPDGTRHVFAERVDTARGTYAWYLSEVETVTGDRTEVSYVHNASGRPFVTVVVYGNRPHVDSYRVELAYDTLAVPFTSHASGVPLSLDRRVSTVTARVRNADTGAYQTRWRYDLGYTASALSPVYFLGTVTRVFASGSAEPAVRYHYDDGQAGLQTAAFSRVASLDTFFGDHDGSDLQPNKATLTDVDEDGRLDFEHHEAFSLMHHTAGGWVEEPLASPPVIDQRCRHSVSDSNTPRTLARMRGDEGPPQVVYTRYYTQDRTDIVLCDRAGTLLFQKNYDALWDLGEDVRLVDLDRDHQPDLIRVWAGNYRVLHNTSTAAGFEFAIQDKGKLKPAFTPTGRWIQDMNGDGIADIVARRASGLVIWYGLGNLQFTEQGELVKLWTTSGNPLGSIASLGLSFVDANKDGLTDLLFTLQNHAYLFTSRGTEFRQVAVPALDGVTWDMSNPIIADLSGSGDVEVTYTHDDRAWALPLSAAGTGLLRSVDDGKGTIVELTYRRAPAAAGIGARAAVLDSLTVDQAGVDPVTVVYDYESPVVHGRGRFLVGYGVTRKLSPFVTDEARFHNDDDVSGLVEATTSSDSRTPGLIRFSSREFQEASYTGVRFLRLSVENEGWQRDDGVIEASDLTEYLTYERDLCPTRVRSTGRHGVLVTESILDTVPALGQALHCLERTRRMTGTHTDAGLDFVHEATVERDDLGLVTRVLHLGASGYLEQQTVGYDALHRVVSVSSPGKGANTATYDPSTGLLASITGTDGVTTTVAARDPVSDALQRMATDHGGGAVLTSELRADGFERLERSWRSLGGSSASKPLTQLSYQFATRTEPGLIRARGLVDAASGSYRETASLLDPAGDSLAALTRIPEGWTVAGLTRRDPLLLETRTYHRAPVTAPDPGSIAFADLYAGGVQLGVAQRAGFGHPVSSSATVQTGVVQTTTAAIDVQDGAVIATAVENGAYTTRTATGLDDEVVWSEDELGAHTSYRYDAAGRLVEVELADGTRHRLTFDSYGRAGAIARDGVGRITYEYAPVTGLLQSRRVYDGADHLERSTSYAYDAGGRVREEVHALAGTAETETFRYRFDGRDAGGQVVVPGQLGYRTHVEGPSFRRDAIYDVDGSLRHSALRLADWMEIVEDSEYTADATPRVVARTITELATGRVVDSVTREVHHDAWGRFADLRVGAQTVAAATYGAGGLIDHIDLLGGGTIAYTYDPTTLALHGTWQDAVAWSTGLEWDLDARGQVRRESFTFGDSTRVRDYTYDARGFLGESREGAQAASYTYTSTGLPLHIDDELGAREAYRGSSPSLQVGTVTYGYDGLGRVVARGAQTLHYGPSGELTRATGGGHEWRYVYDEAGNRLLKLRDGVPVAGYVGSGYLTAAGYTDALRLGDRLVGLIEGGTFRALATDARGTVVADRDGTPRLASPFGARSAHPDTAAAFDFIAKGYDADLGTVRMGRRDYDPLLSQFWTPDPLFLESLDKCAKSPVECSLYGYAANRPLSMVNPAGTESTRINTQAGFDVIHHYNGHDFYEMHDTSTGEGRYFVRYNTGRFEHLGEWVESKNRETFTNSLNNAKHYDALGPEDNERLDNTMKALDTVETIGTKAVLTARAICSFVSGPCRWAFRAFDDPIKFDPDDPDSVAAAAASLPFPGPPGLPSVPGGGGGGGNPSWISEEWGVNRLMSELRERGYRYTGPTTGPGGRMFENDAGDKVRIMPRPQGSPSRSAPLAKYRSGNYFRAKPADSSAGPGAWGPHTSIPDKPRK